MPTPPPPELPEFIEEVAAELHASGAPAHRLEAAIHALGARLGVALTCFATPTSVLLSSAGSTRLLRVQPGGVDLGRLTEVDAIANDVASGRSDLHTGRQRLKDVNTRRRGPPLPAVLVAWMVASACAAAFFGGTYADVGAAAGLGLGSGLLATWGRLGNITEIVAASFAAAAATVLASRVAISTPVVTVAALIIYLPGFTLTVGMAELATRNLVAGTARLAGAGVTFMLLGLGTMLGWRLGAALPALEGAGAPLPTGWQALAIPAMGLALVALFKARWRDAPAIVAAAALVWAASTLAQAGGQEASAAAGAFVAGMAGNAWSRAGRGPASVLTMPSVLMLVPGTIGFRSVSALFDADVLGGVTGAFHMFVVAMSLVTGLLIANLLRRPLRSL